MTIGIAAAGNAAGAAVYDAVLGAELLGRGAIGGFAVMAVCGAAGAAEYRVTQRGGVTALDVPPSWRDARVAAVISSGPDRPEPLTQFLAGAGGVGLVTGHRLPNLPGQDGVALNQAVLARMAGGTHPQDAVDAVLDAHPEWDAGLIAIDMRGRLGMGNSARVRRRDDLGLARREIPPATLGLLHNSIHARGDLAADLADLAWSRLLGGPAALRLLVLKQAADLAPAERDCVHVDGAGVIVRLETANPRLASLNRRGTAVYLGTEVRCGGRRIGTATTELYAELRAGQALPGAEPGQHMLLARMDHVQA